MVERDQITSSHTHRGRPVSLWGVNVTSVFLIVVAFCPCRLLSEQHTLQPVISTPEQTHTHTHNNSMRKLRKQHFFFLFSRVCHKNGNKSSPEWFQTKPQSSKLNLMIVVPTLSTLRPSVPVNKHRTKNSPVHTC